MAAFEVGAVVTGTVSLVPRPGVVVDLGDGSTEGFVDALHLPFEVAEWPRVGTTTTFEVLTRRPGLLRLWPLDPRFQGVYRTGSSEAEWRARKERYPVGAVLAAEVSGVYVAAGSYSVRYDGGSSLLEADGELPEVGLRAEYEVLRHLDTTQRTLLRPAT